MRFFRIRFLLATLGLLILTYSLVQADDVLIREDEIAANESDTVFICGNQTVANQYSVSGRWLTWSADTPSYGPKYTITGASAGTGWPGQSCPNEEFIQLSTNPFAPFQTDARVGEKVRLFAPDTTPPVQSNITAGSITQTSATITWTTNESATHTIKYGTASGSYDSYPNTKSAGSGTSASGAL